MTPATLNLTIYRGITFGPIILNAKDASGAAVNLTGWLVYAQARISELAESDVDLAPAITDSVNGGITLANFTDEQTKVFAAGTYNWDLVLERPTGQRLGPYFKGRCYIKNINTHPAP